MESRAVADQVDDGRAHIQFAVDGQVPEVWKVVPLCNRWPIIDPQDRELDQLSVGIEEAGDMVHLLRFTNLGSVDREMGEPREVDQRKEVVSKIVVGKIGQSHVCEVKAVVQEEVLA